MTKTYFLRAALASLLINALFIALVATQLNWQTSYRPEGAARFAPLCHTDTNGDPE